MPVEPHTFQQVLNLSPQHMLDLVETVGAAALLNASLIIAPESKVAIAIVMLSYVNTMLEQCDCKIETQINNPAWIEPAIYKTKMDEIS